MAGTAIEITICGRKIKLGDKLKVKYTKGGFYNATIQGDVIELWSPATDNGYLQGRLSNGWCFHDTDEIIEYIPKENL